jgi:hypothetical protein
MSTNKFDLNIEKILEDWEVHHAIREVIANALDEQLLSKTKDIEIFKDDKNVWHIRDYGRGLKYQHLTQKENEEKQANPYVIGKFGIGLKDALATFDRKSINVLIRSKYGDITLGKAEKHGFKDIATLHAYISPPSDIRILGTEFLISNATNDDFSKAKELFLRFSGERIIEETDYGSVLERKGDSARIYVNGVRVAEEENFLFSYNITSLNSTIRKALNRERTNVGRTAYSERVKSILTSCQDREVAQSLVNDLRNYQTGELHDELNWIDVQERAVMILNATSKVVFLTPEEMQSATMMVDEARNAGHEIITIPTSLKERIRGKVDIRGSPIRELGQFYKEYNESFDFKFIDPKDLTPTEKTIFNMTDKILSLINGKPKIVKQIIISETMRKELGSFMEAEGLWESGTGRIIIKRSVLKNLERYAGTLLHEMAHARSGALDVSREFELELTSLLGTASSAAVEG